MEIFQLPADTDNYIYLLRDEATNSTFVVDPTQAEPVLALCKEKKWEITALFITHHHPDHIRGVPKLVNEYNCKVYGFEGDQHRLPPLTHPLKDGDVVNIHSHVFNIKHIPGHTLGHIAYYNSPNGLLFSGDTLFSMGCGRLFEGTPEMMISSLGWIRSLPPTTMVHCSHEYTETNTEFAVSIEPNNSALKKFFERIVELRKMNIPTVPFRLETQLPINPFLRWNDSQLKTALGKPIDVSDVETFADLRRRRDQWNFRQQS
jgi:hydroxyacylglutathione hydrolase